MFLNQQDMVADIIEKFKSKTGLTLKVYNGKTQATNSLKLLELNVEDCHIEFSNRMNIETIENIFKHNNLKVIISYDDGKRCQKADTLSKATQKISKLPAKLIDKSAKIKQTLFIAPTTESVNELIKKHSKEYKHLKITTLTHLINEIFEIYDEKNIQLDSYLASSIIYNLISNSANDYFKYLQPNSESFELIYNYFVKLDLNDISISEFGYSEEKQIALSELYNSYKEYKKEHNLFDATDILDVAIQNIENYLSKFESIYLANFTIGNINLYKSEKEKKLLEVISQKSKILQSVEKEFTTKISQNIAFDSYDEVRTAIKIAKSLMLEDKNCSENDIVIVSSDFSEYIPFYKILLDEYGMKGYDTVGVPLNLFMSSSDNSLQYHENFKVQKSYWDYQNKFEKLKGQSEYFKIKLDNATEKRLKEKLLANINVRDTKQGVLFTEANKLLGLEFGYKHIIFIGTDITHFPPKQRKNFLYTQQQSIEKFCGNNVYDASVTLYNELKRLSQNLYIVTASYKGKRKLSQSIILDKKIGQKYNVEHIQSRNDILKQNKRIEELPLKDYQNSISSVEFTKYDGNEIGEFKQASKLSASALNTYAKCPLQYYFGNILGLNAPQDEQDGFDPAERGSLMHECFEYFVKKAKESQNDFLAKSKTELYSIMFECSKEAYASEKIKKTIGKENINHKIDLAVLQNGLDDIESENKAELAKFVDYFVENRFEGFKNSNSEELFMLDSEFKPIDLKNLDPNDGDDKEELSKIDKEHRFIKGFIDRLDNLSNDVNIIDYKSSLTNYPQKDFNLETQKDSNSKTLKNFQLGIYMLYAKQKYPNKTYNAHLLSFKDKNYNDSISLITKIPENFKPKEGNNQPANFFDDEYITAMKNQIKEISTNINTGKFAFNNYDAKTCEYCNYKYICHQDVLNKKIKKEENSDEQ